MSDAKELQRRMSEVRSNLAHDVEQIVTNAQTLSDWRYYVRQHPWACLGGAAALGFLAVPRRIQVTSPDAETLMELARQDRLIVQPRSEAAKEQRGVLGGLLSFAGNMLFRSALAYAGQQIGKFGAQAAARQDTGYPEDAMAGPPDHPR